MKRVLIAGMGNVLRRDDGLGVEVARRLALSANLPEGIKVIEVGIGGIHLVHELMNGYDALMIVDAMERGSPPGTVHVLEAETPDLATWPEEQRQSFLADTHYATPTKAMILAKALGVLPSTVYLVGCQPSNAEQLGIGLSDAVEQAICDMIQTIQRLYAVLSTIKP